MDAEKKKKIWKAIALITFPIWSILAFVFVYLAFILLAPLVGILSLFDKNPLSLKDFELGDVTYSEEPI